MSTVRKQMGTLAAGVAVVMVFAGSSFAQKAFLDRAKKVYGLTPEDIGKCALCHTYDKEKKESPDHDNINAFGKALHKHPAAKSAMKKDEDHKFTKDELDAIEAALKALETEDSDGDGVSNGDELKKKTNPGDAKSK